MRTYGLAETLPDSPLGSAWNLIWVLFVLGVVIALIVLILRFIAKRSRGWGMNRALRSLGGYPLGTNKSMQIVEWNGRIYVLGVGENVTLLDAITEPDVVDALLAEHDAASAGSETVLPEWLRKWTQRNNPQGEERSSERPESGASFEKALESRIRQLSESRRKVEQMLDDDRSEDRTDKR